MDTNYLARTGFTNWLCEQRWLDINGIFISQIDTDFTSNLSPRVMIINHRAYPEDATWLTMNGRDGDTGENTTLWAMYKIEPECANPVMLDWLNGYGAPEQHLFNITQTFEREASTGLVFERAILQDIEDTTVTKRRTVRRWVQRLILEADELTKTQFDVLTELKSSDFIRCYLDKTGAEFVEVVVVSDFTDGGETDEGAFTFRVQIEFPSNFDFFKGKLY